MTTPVFAVERIDTWVLRVSIAIPVVCVTALVLWHLFAYLARKLGPTPKVGRPSPEPPQVFRPPKPPAGAAAGDAQGERARRVRELLALAASLSDLPEGAESRQLATQIRNDPERLQRACAALAESLAELYLELAESWLRNGQPRHAAAALGNLVRCCPETRLAEVARGRLRQLGAAEKQP
jgi:hypothetical protein